MNNCEEMDTVSRILNNLKGKGQDISIDGAIQLSGRFYKYDEIMLVHRLTYHRTNHKNLHMHGYKGEGTTTTPFDRVVLNDMDRFHLVSDVIDRLPSLGSRGAYTKQYLRNKVLDPKAYIEMHGEDMPEIVNWKWNLASTGTDAK